MPSKSEIQEIMNLLVVEDHGEISFTHSIFVQCFLPIRSLAKTETRYQVDHGNASLLIQAGTLIKPGDAKLWEAREIPSGAKARLLFSYINNQAIKTANPIIDMGRSLREFMEKNGVPVGGANAKEIVKQVKNIAASEIMLGVWGKNLATQHQTKIAKSISFWIEKDPHQGTLWQPTMTLSSDYMETLRHHQVPLDFRSLAALQGNPRAMDIYCWLSYRLRSITTPVKIPYEALHPIFGKGIKQLKHFKLHFKKAIIEAHKYYPEARVGIDRDYITLYHSPSPIAINNKSQKYLISA